MVADAAAQDRRFPWPGVPASFLLSAKPVQDELNLSAEQARKVREAKEKDQETKEAIVAGPAAEGEKRWRTLVQESEKTVAALLTPTQLRRFRQIRLQQVGALALNDPKLAEELKLTESQRKAVKVIVEARKAQTDKVLADKDLTEREVAAKLTDLTKAADTNIRNLLTAGQKAKWEEMIGEPFRWPTP
jgi:hypothetical protein